MSHPDAIRTMNEYDITPTPNILEQVRFPECASSGLVHAQRLLLPRTRRSTCDDRSMTSRPADEGGYLSRAVLFTTWMMQISRLPRSRMWPAAVARRMDACKYQRSTATHAACQQAASLPSRRFFEGRYCLAPHTKVNMRGTIASLLRSPVGKPVVHWARQTQNSAWRVLASDDAILQSKPC